MRQNTSKRAKKILLIVITVTLIMTLFGCGDSKEPDNQTNSEKKDKVMELEELSEVTDNFRTYYEVFVYSFCDSDGDGIGDINGLTSKLEYIKNIGFNGLWLTPIMQSTTYHKYDVVDYMSIDKEFGTIDDFKKFMNRCKELNIKVILDLPINHTSAKTKWFTELWTYIDGLKNGQNADSKDCKYVDYYNLTTDDELGDKYYRIGSSSYLYEAQFWDQMPDLNLGNKQVQREIEKIIDFWLDLGVGGFRLDAAKEYYSGQSTKNIEILKWITDYVKSKNKDNYLVAEVWDSFNSIEQYYTSGIDSIFNYEYGTATGAVISAVQSPVERGYKLAKLIEKDENSIRLINKEAIDAPFINNHDNARTAGATVYDEAKIKMAGAINLLMPGASFTYYGEEIGMSGSGKDENLRSPMYWSKEDESGMTKGPDTMEQQDNKFPSVEGQLDNPDSILNYYKKAVWIRNKYPAIPRGKVTSVDTGNDFVCATKRDTEKEKLLLIYNIENEPCEIDLDAIGCSDYKFENALSTDYNTADIKESDDSENTMQTTSKLKVEAYGIVILKK